MKCEITRASRWEGQPCPEAAQEQLVRIDRRTFKTPEEHDIKWGHRGKWLDEGTNHRKERGGIVRDLKAEPVWVASFETLVDVLAFMDREGAIVIRPSADYVGIDYRLTIYDDYME